MVYNPFACAIFSHISTQFLTTWSISRSESTMSCRTLCESELTSCQTLCASSVTDLVDTENTPFIDRWHTWYWHKTQTHTPLILTQNTPGWCLPAHKEPWWRATAISWTTTLTPTGTLSYSDNCQQSDSQDSFPPTRSPSLLQSFPIPRENKQTPFQALWKHGFHIKDHKYR